MASGKESPRQKMIGMMYLVLTALLALNVSKEILNAFVVVNNGLENTNINFDDQNERLYKQFDEARAGNPIKVTPNWEKAQQVKKQTAELFTFIDELKKELLMKTEDLTREEADTMQLKSVNAKDNYDIPTHLLIGAKEDGSEGKAAELKKKLEAFKGSLMGLVLAEDQERIQLPINTQNPQNTEAKETWETWNFFHSPLAACITILSKLQTDVKNSEYALVDYLLKQTDMDVLKFDTVAAKVVAQSNYVLLGEKYKADVFIAAFSKSQNPNVLIGDYDATKDNFNGSYDSIMVDHGLGRYEQLTSKEGITKYKGVIKTKTPKGRVVNYPFESEYIVAKPSLTVSADKMNVLYMGVPNPISVSVPGISSDKLQVSIDNGNLKPTGPGQFDAKVLSGTKSKVIVTATLENGEKRNMGSIEFRVKPLPKPFASFAASGGGKISLKRVKVADGVLATYGTDFLFDLSVRVVSFSMVAYVRGSYIEYKSSNNRLTPEMKNAINNLRKGDRFFIEEILAMGDDGVKHNLGSIAYSVTD